MADDNLTPPKPTPRDAARSLVKAGVSAAPYIGGPAAELFELVVPSSLNCRREGWFELVAAKLRELEERDVNLEDLANDEGFISAFGATSFCREFCTSSRGAERRTGSGRSVTNSMARSLDLK